MSRPVGVLTGRRTDLVWLIDPPPPMLPLRAWLFGHGIIPELVAGYVIRGDGRLVLFLLY